MILKILYRLFFFYIASVVFVFFGQRWLLFHPNTTLEEPYKYGLVNFKEVEIITDDEINLSCWYKKAEKNLPTIIYFHGNAGNLSNRALRYGLLAKDGYGVLAISYRGYGKSKGNPTEKGFYKDGRAGFEFLKKEGVEDILIFGESLGTGVAVQMALEFRNKGVILEAPYTSIPDIAGRIYFWLPVNLLARDKFESIKKIGNIKSQVLIFHGIEDNVIKIKYGRKLFNTANEPKKMIEVPEAGHYIDHELIIKEMKGFF